MDWGTRRHPSRTLRATSGAPATRRVTMVVVNHGDHARRRWWTAWLEACGVGAVVCLLGVLGVRLAQSVDSGASAVVALIAAVAGYFLADVATGAVHWFCDTFFEEDTPVIGALVIAPFREHHRDPLGMTRHVFLELTGNSCLALTAVVAAVLWFGPRSSSGSISAAAIYGFTFALALAAGATNLFHRWAHEPEPPRAIRALQRSGWILSSVHHAQRHAPPHDAAYCVTNGWANAMLDGLRFFPRAERALTALGLPRSSS